MPSVTPSESASSARSATSVRSTASGRRHDVRRHVVGDDEPLPQPRARRTATSAGAAKRSKRESPRFVVRASCRAVGGGARAATSAESRRQYAREFRRRDAEIVAARIRLVDRDVGDRCGRDARAITATRVDRNTASSMLCVTKTTVSPRARPQREELGVEALPREFVERAERLVHQQQIRLRRRARARSTRASACRRRARAENAARNRRGPTSASAAAASRVGRSRARRGRDRAAGARSRRRAPRASASATGTRSRAGGRAPPVAAKSPPHQRERAGARREQTRRSG